MEAILHLIDNVFEKKFSEYYNIEATDYLLLKCNLEAGIIKITDILPTKIATVVNKGYTSIVKLLLDYGADVHGFYDLYLSFAVGTQKINMIKLLLDYGARPDSTCFALAKLKSTERENIIGLFVDYGAAVDELRQGIKEAEERIKVEDEIYISKLYF
jgi:hypothetical protein